MDIRKLSDAFGVTIDQLAEISGVSQYELHSLIQNGAGDDKAKIKALTKLRAVSYDFYEQDINEAKWQLSRRLKILKELEG